MLWPGLNLMETIFDFIDNHQQSFIDRLIDYLRRPSISAHGIGMGEVADYLLTWLIELGLDAHLMPTPGWPLVLGRRFDQPAAPTVLLYGHYDVQPPEPLELWESPPFKPTLRDGKLFARGVSDDKGHLTSRLFAIDALLAKDGELPCNIKFVIEGEEETSSVHLHDYIVANKIKLAADACIWEFGGIDHRGIPMQYLGLRGICYVELWVETASTDIHSGLGGSILPNAAWRLVWALRSLKGSDEQIRIPGFYDKVQKPSQRDIALFEALPEVADEYKSRFGVKNFIKGLKDGVDLRIAEVFEPTCTICGLTSGYQGKGSKTVQPSRASAKVDFRLVPDQDPEEILKLLRAHLDAEGFSDIQIDYLGGERPARTDPDHPFVKLVVDTSKEVYGVPMEIVPMVGGSGPNYPFIHELNLPVATAGLGYPDTRAHAPNENIRIDLYLMHAKHMARVINEFSK